MERKLDMLTINNNSRLFYFTMLTVLEDLNILFEYNRFEHSEINWMIKKAHVLPNIPTITF